MRKVNILTDYTCDLTEEILKERNITAFPLFVNIGNASYKDHIELNPKDLFTIMEDTKELAMTAAPSSAMIEEYVNKFPEDEDILYLGIGSGFSSCFNSARLVALDHPNFYPVDSKNITTGTGLLIMKACDLRDKGLGIEEIIKEINDMIPRIRVQFGIDTLKYLHKGGRCSGTERILGLALRIKPIIRVIDGAMKVTKKPMGSFQRALDAQIDNMIADKDNIDLEYFFITHPDAHSDALYLRKKLKEVGIVAKHIIETTASCVISTHCGPRTCGVIYMVNK